MQKKDARCEAEATLLENLSFITTRALRLSHRLNCPDLGDEFRSYVLLKLVDRDYAILRKFEGRSGIKTYLDIVLRRLLLDFQDHAWGKWRPSAKARRLGELGVRYERLVNRDELSPSEAHEALQAELGPRAEDLDAIVEALPPRPKRRHVRIDPNELSADASQESRAIRAQLGRKLASHLEAALASLSEDDKELIRERYCHGRTIQDIASELGEDARKLYPRYRRIALQLRKLADPSGVSEDSAALGQFILSTEFDLESSLNTATAAGRNLRPHVA